MSGKVSVTHLCCLHPPSAVPGMRESKEISKKGGTDVSQILVAFVSFKNLSRFLQKKYGKHLKISKKDLSWVAKFVSHNGSRSS